MNRRGALTPTKVWRDLADTTVWGLGQETDSGWGRNSKLLMGQVMEFSGTRDKMAEFCGCNKTHSTFTRFIFCYAIPSQLKDNYEGCANGSGMSSFCTSTRTCVRSPSTPTKSWVWLRVPVASVHKRQRQQDHWDLLPTSLTPVKDRVFGGVMWRVTEASLPSTWLTGSIQHSPSHHGVTHLSSQHPGG